MSKLLMSIVTATLLSTVLTGCDLEILPMPAGVLYADGCADCYDTVVEEIYVEPPMVIVTEPAYVVDTYYVDEPIVVQDTYTAEVAVDQVYDGYPANQPSPDEVYVEGDYVAST